MINKKIISIVIVGKCFKFSSLLQRMREKEGDFKNYPNDNKTMFLVKI